MSIMTYLILFLVAGYLFKVNPVLCVGLVGAVVFFKIRGFFGGRHARGRACESSKATEAAMVAMCIALLERSERTEQTSRDRNERPSAREDDPLEGLFLD